MKLLGSRIARLAVVTTLVLVSGALNANEPGIDHPRRGDFKDDYRDPDTKALIMRYRMIVPERLAEKRTLGLVVAFHGLNGNEDHMTGFAHRSARSVEIADEYVIMGGKSKDERWSENDDDEVLAWIEWVMSTYPIDPRRVHIIGMSNGGWMVKRFGWAHQNLFASVSSYCGAGAGLSGSPGAARRSSRRRQAGPGETRTEWYFVHGDADKTVDVESSRLAVKQLAQRGYRYIYREIDGANHGGILGYPEVAADNFRFIHALRNKEIELSKDERMTLASSQKQLKKASADTALPRIAEIARLGGPAAAAALKSALRNSDAAVRKAAIQAAGSVLFGRVVVLELIRLTRDKSNEIRSSGSRFRHLARLSKRDRCETFLRPPLRRRSFGA